MSDEQIQQESQPTENAKPQLTPVEHRARTFRRIGFGIFGSIIVIVSSFLIYSAFHDINQKTVYDPITNENVMK